MINTVTPALFAKYPDPAALARADQAEVEEMVKSTGFFRMKAKHLIETAQAIVLRHGGRVPETMAELVALPGVARKTANVVLGCALGKNEGFIVDTHITRLAARLGLSRNTDPEKIEQDLMALVPRDQWTAVANRLIWHGRRVCVAKAPDCDHCGLAPQCPSFGAFPRPEPERKAGNAGNVENAGNAENAENAEKQAGAAKAKPAQKPPQKPAQKQKPKAAGKARPGAGARP
jgi:endonuclease-3